MMIAAAALVASLLASDRTDPVAYFAAEATVVTIKPQAPDASNEVVWNEVTFTVKRCVGGTCIPNDTVKVLVAAAVWHGKAGDVMGIVEYGWMDEFGKPRSWSQALSLDDETSRERFHHEGDVAASEKPTRAAIAVRKADDAVAER